MTNLGRVAGQLPLHELKIQMEMEMVNQTYLMEVLLAHKFLVLSLVDQIVQQE